MSTFEEFLNLVLPSRCVICRSIGSPICNSCRKIHLTGFREVRRFELSGIAICEYTNEVAQVIHELKENSQTSIAKTLAKEIALHMPNDCEVLVPMPSKTASFQKRGFNPALILANAIAKEVARTQNRLIKVANLISLGREVEDQAALDGHERRSNLIGSMWAKEFSTANPVWLVDDIVTTGATLSEAARSLATVGIGVGGFLTFAETLPKNRQKPNKAAV